jgi:hypothetical protein
MTPGSDHVPINRSERSGVYYAPGSNKEVIHHGGASPGCIETIIQLIFRIEQ